VQEIGYSAIELKAMGQAINKTVTIGAILLHAPPVLRCSPLPFYVVTSSTRKISEVSQSLA